MGPYILKCKARDVKSQNPETKPLWLGSRPAVSNSESVWCRMVSLEVVVVMGIVFGNMSRRRGVWD